MNIIALVCFILSCALAQNTTTTVVPSNSTTSGTTTTSKSTTSTTLPDTTAPANSTTTTPGNTTTTLAPDTTTPSNGTTTTIPVTTPSNATTPTESPTPAPNQGGFSGSSFFGGMVFSAALIAAAFFGLKFYRARNPDYRTLSDKIQIDGIFFTNRKNHESVKRYNAANLDLEACMAEGDLKIDTGSALSILSPNGLNKVLHRQLG
ncbi:Oidioi.mRNA.OKI2018_I69.XSR.g13942.t1.cds [Oikopleura dioica]|uniref:Oidioi.mRNA.OKI2018_I69.XSR.g13942.t1.cds n=1 Tax=Oikopleura dioica TaxID=34765 RepID=A0ABN7SD64_OIKDI|nr:Oidioi.mRNA.OKI2018_I69.XSR.g13942.t1.cds [Oikopleura dioica]